jgi:hypothetical protein
MGSTWAANPHRMRDPHEEEIVERALKEARDFVSRI